MSAHTFTVSLEAVARVTVTAVAAALSGLLLTACAAPGSPPVPDAIRNPPPGDLQLVDGRRDPHRYGGAPVRWGGTVIAVEPATSGRTRVQVLEHRLGAAGRPVPGSPSGGGFIIDVAPTVNAERYARGADITVAGTLSGVAEALIGNGPAQLPVVRVRELLRWEPLRPGDPYYPPWPWFGPRVKFGIGVSNFHYRPGHGDAVSGW